MPLCQTLRFFVARREKHFCFNCKLLKFKVVVVGESVKLSTEHRLNLSTATQWSFNLHSRWLYLHPNSRAVDQLISCEILSFSKRSSTVQTCEERQQMVEASFWSAVLSKGMQWMSTFRGKDQEKLLMKVKYLEERRCLEKIQMRPGDKWSCPSDFLRLWVSRFLEQLAKQPLEKAQALNVMI